MWKPAILSSGAATRRSAGRWGDIYDQQALTMKVRFYKKDGPLDAASGDPKDLVYSDFFTYALK
jgi:hypothetical protein